MDAVTRLSAQWRNPSDVLTVLMIIGGDVVQKALAQSTGTWFTPVCFSFGWVAYSFMALVSIMADGRLLPQADYPVKVFNLKSGYARENKNWVIGRIVRDHETWINRKVRCHKGIRIAVFEAQTNSNSWTSFSYGWIHLFGLFGMLVQLAIASLPIIFDRDWSVLLITGAGTLLALTHGSLPQWTAEKLPNRQHAEFTFGLTTGNGSKDIIIIKGKNRCLNLEELAASDTPRDERPWQKFSKEVVGRRRSRLCGWFPSSWASSFLSLSTEFRGFPVGFWITVITCIVQSILWILLLITVVAVTHNSWYLFLVGAIGMFQNGVIAAINRPPQARNLPLELEDIIICPKVMDGLMELEDKFGCARPLIKEFFPGDLEQEEQAWWRGNREPYERKRKEQMRSSGITHGDSQSEKRVVENFITPLEPIEEGRGFSLRISPTWS